MANVAQMQSGEAAVEDRLVSNRGLWSDAIRRLRKNRPAMVALIVLSLIILLVITSELFPFVQRHDPFFQDYARDANGELNSIHLGPTAAHPFGTDNLGRDTWSRVLQGTRISLQIGIGTQIVALAIGLLIGGAAAVGGRFTDSILMRFTDLTYAFPDLLFIILLRAVVAGRDWPLIGTGDPQIPYLEGPLLQVTLAIAFTSWVTIARLVRGQMLSLAQRDYIVAARALGASEARVVFRHMLPNTLGPVIVAVTFGIPTAIFAEAVLGFIGLGVPIPTASLGRLVADGYSFVDLNAWVVAFPAATIALLMLCFTFLGDGLRDALDPRTR